MKVWRKTNRDGSPVCSPGWWSRSSCEFLLVGVLASAKGSILGRKTTNCEPQEFASVRGAHSAKPPEITQAVADFLDVEKRLELFCRAPHPQFDSWGERLVRTRPIFICAPASSWQRPKTTSSSTLSSPSGR